MAQLTTYIYPTANGTVGHSVNTGSGYAAIDDPWDSADDDTTYIYQNIISTSSSTKTSTFTMTGTIPQYPNLSFVSAKLVIRAEKVDPDGNTMSCTAKTEVNGNTGSAQAVTLNTSYSNTEFNLAQSQFQSGSNSIILTIESKGSLSSKNNSNAQVKITQAYIAVVYEASYNISEIITGKGSVDPSNLTTADPNSTLTFVLTPDNGAQVIQVLDNNIDVTNQLTVSGGTRNIIDDDFTIAQRGTASYGFTKQTTNLTYRSTISGNQQRAGITRFTTNFPVDVEITCTIKIKGGNNGTNDSIMIGNIDYSLPTTANNSTSNTQWSSNGTTSTSVTTKTYTFTMPYGEHFIDIKNYHYNANNSRYVEITFSGQIIQNSNERQYTITNVSTNHDLIFKFSGEILSIKIGDNWQNCIVWKKQNGTWVQQASLENLFDTTKNYERYYNWFINKVLSRSSGETNATNWVTTDFIKVSPGVAVTVTGQQYNGTNGVMWNDYKEDKTYNNYWSASGTVITSVGNINIYERTLAANNMTDVYYIRVNCLKDALQYCKVVQNGITLFDGSKARYD